LCFYTAGPGQPEVHIWARRGDHPGQQVAIDCALFITFDISHISLGHGYLWLKNMVHYITGKILTMRRVTIDQAQVEIKMFCEIANGSTDDFILNVLFARAAGGLTPLWPIHWTIIVLCFPHFHSNNRHFWSRQKAIVQPVREFLQTVNKKIIDLLESIDSWEVFVLFANGYKPLARCFICL
jgi:hypothetical protein